MATLVSVCLGEVPCAEATAAAPATGRDTTLDALRGICILMMIVNHLGPETLANRISHAPLYVDGASGFVFLSGFVLAMIHPRRVTRLGEWGVARVILWRAAMLWGVHVLLTAFFLAIHALWPGSFPVASSVNPAEGILRLAGNVATFRLLPPYLDILPMYVVFLALAPLGLALLRRGRWGLLAGFVGGAYAASQAIPDAFRLGTSEGGFSQGFNLAAWQLLFFGGMAAGYRKATGAPFAAAKHRLILTAAGAVFAACFAVAQTQRPALAAIDFIGPRAEAAVLDKASLGIGRVAFFAAAAVFFSGLMRSLSAWPLVAGFLRPLELAGRSSLYLYILHLLLLFVLMGFGLHGSQGGLLAEAQLALVVAGLYLAARFQFLHRIIPN